MQPGSLPCRVTADLLCSSVLKEQSSRLPPLPTSSWSKEDIEMDESSVIMASALATSGRHAAG